MDGLKLSIDVAHDTLVYRRECGDETVEKTLMKSNCKVIIYPVEPVNRPRNITSYFLVELERPVLIPPEETCTIYSTFPIEMGVFVFGNKSISIVDIFSFIKPKYIQYGELTKGIICRYWKGKVTMVPPATDPLREGILEMSLTNPTQVWMEIRKVVFDAFPMKIYYSHDCVSLRGVLRIIKEGMAETWFIDSPLKEEMEKAYELYHIRRPAVISKRFIMEGGL